MHEMAIAEGILDIAVKTAVSHGAAKVTGVKVLAGELTGIVPEALEFGFSALAAGTVADGAQLSICMVPLTGRCRDCGHESRVDKYRFVCGSCNSYAVEIVSGRELKVESVEVE
ncbi:MULTISPECIES: hydrogenase maturation nickel metallochaperone HypA [Sporomusa]|jgi:hydrogenase nickel incorporation protein HypA/HybF|uniref:Hydrogenase maturation factor HypA n=1 Tax=Sporomusa sphaeroides DSM 2875 TaxID=1337886 RepID=A0ABM9W1L0_9FIRM|nr:MULTISPECIES: hydrogenase maturation nickel metallochaperone HypA [Sporomusa]MCM0761411.1 hydrogenase maturation nickel metallochaperone HypA [Sporomusa sphaeroides DSM 2875]OLS56580.1 hydrogenase nickel incorporation protein HypA [Sporomusa sphaeroides DSM 2875]CVK19052.1 hydrogenase nickel incorporation protein [Sporomusa sphaeroides DSM 2875]HML32575.1 hydrogenase maturation nickel metallochaperone HypA [Sporomusa sphaeroides]